MGAVFEEPSFFLLPPPHKPPALAYMAILRTPLLGRGLLHPVWKGGGARWPVQVSLHVIALCKHSTASLPEPHLCLLSLGRAKVFFTL